MNYQPKKNTKTYTIFCDDVDGLDVNDDYDVSSGFVNGYANGYANDGYDDESADHCDGVNTRASENVIDYEDDDDDGMIVVEVTFVFSHQPFHDFRNDEFCLFLCDRRH